MAGKRPWRGPGHGGVNLRFGAAPDRQPYRVRDDGLFAGSVSAGCIEGAIIEEALAAMKKMAAIAL